MTRKSEMMRQDIQLEFTKTMHTLKDLWDEIGFSDQEIASRGQRVLLHVRDLFDQMVTEETALKTKLISVIADYETRVGALCLELSLPPFEVDDGLGIKQREKCLRLKNNELNKLRNERLADLASLKAEEEDLCDQLYITPYYIKKGLVPSQSQLDEIKDHINTLKTEKKNRKDLVKSQKTEILMLYDELGLTPDTSFSQGFFEDDSVICYLTTVKMEEVKKLLDDLVFRKSEATIKVEELWKQIIELWDRLEVDSLTCDAVRLEYNGIKSRDIEGLEHTLLELQATKLANMQKLTESIRSDIDILWQKCYYSVEQRQRFSAAYDENYTEELLTAHEKELKRLQEYYEKHKIMFTSVTKWQTLFNRMLELDEKQRNPDPNRYNNRGGQLLAEERERKKITNELPKKEEQLFNSIEMWETEMNEPFLIEGTRFTDYVHSQWEAHHIKKESEKQQRMMKKQNEIKMEMTFGSTPKTPTKRHQLAPRTPLTAGKKKRGGGAAVGGNMTTRSTLGGTTPLTPSNRTNLYSSRASPGRTPISFRVKPGATMTFGSEKKPASSKSSKRPIDSKNNKTPSIKRTKSVVNLKTISEQEKKKQTTTHESTTVSSTKSAPPMAGDPDSTFSVTVISEDPSSTRPAAAVEVPHNVMYDDFAAEITKSGSKVMRSSAFGEGRYL